MKAMMARSGGKPSGKRAVDDSEGARDLVGAGEHSFSRLL